ncbi:Uncharacterized protein PECH_008004 [Penicillium ucsense]|uniref:EF hand domain protein n=1 Tax=Penicillium ucsense TaxID=2839758 RepID=A0A8J8W3X9_9EURO|nr:Uncharacterized protein PECM_007818 [Penicillium ucsense]KAF7734415.1 Uncharacterized protein PECH_008004 [Penicillium ucsense]
MSEPRSGPVSLTRYRPILYLFTGVAAAYAVIYIRNSVTSSRPPPPSTVRRRNAMRRTRGQSDERPRLEDTPSYRAISHLELLERENGVYGTFRIETEDGRRVESGLLPSLLSTRDQLMEEVGVLPAHAERMREMMEDTFLRSFLALDFPPTHTLPEGSRERAYLTAQLEQRGISATGIERALARFNADDNYGEELRRRRQNGERVTLSTPTFPLANETDQNQEGGETVVDDQSVFSWREGNHEASPMREGQNLLNLLYHIAEDQARRDGYIHRGVTCNSCGAMPIQGIRYRCANCIDYDLCETCEAMQVHVKTHLFYKVRIPAPFLGNPRQSQPVWYPGKPLSMPRSLPRPLAKRLIRETQFENTEIDALWDQFRCLASHEWADDPNKIYMAIDRKTFDRCFVPNTSVRPPPPSLIYDRMFAFYDTNGDNLIGFEEFLKGLASLNNKSTDERLRRVFRGYDIDGDGYVERKDFLRMFRAYYTLSRELTRDMVAGLEDDFLDGGARDVILGSQPISSAFPGTIPAGEASRVGEGKRVNADGDMEIVDNSGITRPDSADIGDRYSVIGDASVRQQFGRTRPLFPSGVRLPNIVVEPRQHENTEGGEVGENNDPEAERREEAVQAGELNDEVVWPRSSSVQPEDIVNIIGTYVPPKITNPTRARLVTIIFDRFRDSEERRFEEARRNGIDERWRRRAFYTDEEDGATIPDGYRRDPAFDDYDDDASDGTSVDDPAAHESHPPSPRSRSSSKVRFEDDIPDDYDVRSNLSTSSRSIPVGERWGGFEIPEVERDAGKEYLYQVTQQGFNELLDILFKEKEDLMMEVYRTRADRKTWAHEIEQYESVAQKPPPKGEEALFPKNEEHLHEMTQERSLDDLLSRAGYSVSSPTLEPVDAQPVLAPTVSPRAITPGSGVPSISAFSSHVSRGPEVYTPLGRLEGIGGGHDEDEWTDSVTSSVGEVDQMSMSDHVTFEESTDMAPEDVSEPSFAYDPTLPQFRPEADSFDEPAAVIVDRSVGGLDSHRLPSQLVLLPESTISLPAPSSPHLSSADAEETAPKLSPSPMQPLPPPPASFTPTQESSVPQRPGPRTLARWAYLNRLEREAKERGGSGAKLSFEEFSKRMMNDKGRRLAFVASWIEMASF